MLEQNGHQVSAVLVGVSAGRQLPDFFSQHFKESIQTFLSPHLVFDKNGISFSKTIWYHLFKCRRYFRSLREIHQAVSTHQPDVIVNFYDALGGFYSLFYRPQIPIVCVGHHYLFLHPDFQFPQKHVLDRWLLKLNTRLTAIRAKKLLALSFREMVFPTNPKLVIVPPLLRQEINQLSPTKQDFVLAYVTYAAMSQYIIDWHHQNPHIRLNCFWDNPEYPNEYAYDDTLTFHRVNGQKYLSMMADCKALVTSAGFESVCEAMYLGKPTMMVPAHYEQSCNALDAQIAGAGIAADTFDVSLLLQYLPNHQDIQARFKTWNEQASTLFLANL
jgi:uncharacterized protein (TIGR00661 family)